jgi:hypothetical protein
VPELQNSIKVAEDLCSRLYEALLARLDPETERILRCCEGLQIAIGLASGNWRWGPRCTWDWEHHPLGDAIEEAHKLLSATAVEKLPSLDLAHTSITAVSVGDSGL